MGLDQVQAVPAARKRTGVSGGESRVSTKLEFKLQLARHATTSMPCSRHEENRSPQKKERHDAYERDRIGAPICLGASP